ncbi:hypothetical protein HC024_00295 [Methylococcaceae bacterium WWC4]|nr:hypothetical protein [Methylococcaceae bacterium WWC4]
MADLDWLRQAVAKGLSGLVVLHLDGGPSAETVAHTAGVWFHVMRAWPITWDEGLDRPRLRIAFTALASQAKRWPAPAELRALLPAREYPQPALPNEYPEDKAKRNLVALSVVQQLAEERAALVRKLEFAAEPLATELLKQIAEIEAYQEKAYRHD